MKITDIHVQDKKRVERTTKVALHTTYILHTTTYYIDTLYPCSI